MKPTNLIIPCMLTSLLMGLTACVNTRQNASAQFQASFNAQDYRVNQFDRAEANPTGLAGFFHGAINLLWFWHQANRPQGWQSDHYLGGYPNRNPHHYPSAPLYP